MCILIVTRKNDPHADLVIRSLRNSGETFFRLNTECINEYDLSLTVEGGHIVHRDSGRSVDIQSVRSVYLRRQVPIEAGLSESDLSFVHPEWKSFYECLWSALEDVLWVSSPTALRYAGNKLRQLKYAARLGFKIPESVMTNDYKQVAVLQSNEHPVLYKPFNSGVYGDSDMMIYSNIIPELLEEKDAPALRLSPGIFQNYIEKDFEVRVTVVGERVFAARIDSQSEEGTRVDWRRYGSGELPHYPHELDRVTAQRCSILVSDLGLKFGAIDLIVSLSGDIYFLEVNGNGQWAWLEIMTGHLISDAIARILAK